MDSQSLIHVIIFFCFILILTAIIIGLIAYKIAYTIEAHNVKRSSERFQYLIQIKNTLNSEVLSPQYYYEKSLNSKSQLDRIDVDVQMMNLISDNILSANVIRKAEINRWKRAEYEQLIKSAPFYKQPEHGFYFHVEKKLTTQIEQELKPVIPIFRVTFHYTSPKGRNHYSKSYCFSVEEIVAYTDKIENLENYRNTAQYQRSIMSKSLRYDVMKRDNFRCVLCGLSAKDGVQLHVDHIRPVSKGGKTEMSNLITLCEHCNLGKRDKFDPLDCN